MLHSKHITIPSGQTEAEPIWTRFKVNQGVFYRVWVVFPAGCAGLVKLRIFHEGHPILPVEADAYLRGDNYVFEIPLFFEIFGAPQLISIQAWNEDDVYEHTIDVMFLIIPRTWILPGGITGGLIQLMRNLFVKPLPGEIIKDIDLEESPK